MNPDTVGELVRLLIVLIVIIALVFYILRQQEKGRIVRAITAKEHDNADMDAEDMRRTIEGLTATVTTLGRQLEDALRRVRTLEADNGRLQARVSELESQVKNGGKQPVNCLPPIPLEVIVGTDMSFFERDRAALRRAGVAFRRITNATQATIKAELRRRRQDNSASPWWLISAHAGEQGVELVDGIAPPSFWNDVMNGVQLVVLAACKASTTADDLAGLVDTVIWFHESVENRDAADFNYALFRRLITGMLVDQAFAEAVREVPSVAEFVDIRHS